VILYIDTSAFMKPFIGEPEGPIMAALLAERGDDCISSRLLDVEASRVAGRIGGEAPHVVDQALGVIQRVPIGPTLLATAASILPGASLGALGAIHLATALSIPEPTTVVTYDRRLQDACRQVGLPVLAPA
jgi:predicted nucleic acid-binding protein